MYLGVIKIVGFKIFYYRLLIEDNQGLPVGRIVSFLWDQTNVSQVFTGQLANRRTEIVLLC